MKPFPKREDFTGDRYFAIRKREFQRARADWYRDEVVPLLRQARKAQQVAQSLHLATDITAALKACEEDKPC